MANGVGPWGLWKEVLEKHGFGAVIVLILLLAMLGIVPSPLSKIDAHTARDQQRESLALAVCLNLAELTRAVRGESGPTHGEDIASARCWGAMYGTGPISEAVRELMKKRERGG